MKKNYLLFSLVIFAIFAFSANFASALEIKDYPSIPLPGLKTITENSSLPDFIAYYFGLLIYISGAVSLISFVVGAVGLLNPNIEEHKDAKDRMKGAVLGLVLTLSSFIILQTINPVLTKPSITPLPGTPGVYYYNGTKERRSVGKSEGNVANRGEDLIKNNYDNIIYDCAKGAEKTEPDLLVWEFDKPGLEGGNDLSKNVRVSILSCGGILPIDGLGSFKWEKDGPGIYYCYNGCSGGNMCSGYMSYANTSSQDFIAAPFTGEIKGVRIVGSGDSWTNWGGRHYGIIFHQIVGLENGGFCNEPIIHTGDGARCVEVKKPKYTTAADIFLANEDVLGSGPGITFYSEPHGWGTGQEAGYFEMGPEKFLFPSKIIRPKDVCFAYNNVNQPDAYMYKCSKNASCNADWDGDKKCSVSACASFHDCPGSIELKGSYLVGLYSDATDAASGTKDKYCQTFTKSVANLKAQPFLASGASNINFNEIYIIPTK